MSHTGLEICIDSLQSAINATRGRCDQLEVCSALSLGGLTPSIGLLQSIQDNIPEASSSVQLMIMIRPRSGNFVYSNEEIDVMGCDLELLAERFPSAGFVFGILNEDNSLDEEALAALIAVVRKETKLTLHRAFDFLPDWKQGVDAAIRLGFSSILTSGQRPTAMEGKERLAEIVNYAKEKGSGVNSTNIHKLCQETKAFFYHGSASVTVQSNVSPAPFLMGSAETEVVKRASQEEVSAMRDAIFKAFAGISETDSSVK